MTRNTSDSLQTWGERVGAGIVGAFQLTGTIVQRIACSTAEVCPSIDTADNWGKRLGVSPLPSAMGAQAVATAVEVLMQQREQQSSSKTRQGNSR